MPERLASSSNSYLRMYCSLSKVCIPLKGLVPADETLSYTSIKVFIKTVREALCYLLLIVYLSTRLTIHLRRICSSTRSPVRASSLSKIGKTSSYRL